MKEKRFHERMTVVLSHFNTPDGENSRISDAGDKIWGASGVNTARATKMLNICLRDVTIEKEGQVFQICWNSRFVGLCRFLGKFNNGMFCNCFTNYII